MLYRSRNVLYHIGGVQTSHAIEGKFVFRLHLTKLKDGMETTKDILFLFKPQTADTRQREVYNLIVATINAMFANVNNEPKHNAQNQVIVTTPILRKLSKELQLANGVDSVSVELRE